MAITRDGYAQNHATAGGTSSGTVTLSTTNSGDILVLCVQSDTVGHAGGSIVTGVSSANTTGWTKRVSIPNNTESSNLDIWYGKAAGPLTSEVITFTFTAALDMWSALANGFSGVDQTTIWDTNVALPASQVDTSSSLVPFVSGVSTSAVNTMIIMVAGGLNFNSFTDPGSAPSGFTSMGTPGQSTAGNDFTEIYGAFQAQTATQSGLTITLSSGNFSAWTAWADALRSAGQAVITKTTTYTVGF
jgi:hypothetical protein